MPFIRMPVGGRVIRGRSPIISGVVPPREYSAEAQQIIDRLTISAYSEARLDAIANCIEGLVSDGLWTTLLAFWVRAAPTESDALLNWVSTNFSSVKVGSPTFAANRGFTGTNNNTGYLRLNFNPSTNGGSLFTQNSATFGVFNLSNSDDADFTGVRTTSPTAAAARIQFRSGLIGFSLNDGSTSNTSTTNAIPNPVGAISISRTSSALVTAYRDGSVIGTASTTSTGLAAHELYELSQNVDGLATGGLPHETAAGWIAGGWTQAQNTAFFRRLRQYFADMGLLSSPTWGYFYTASQTTIWSDPILRATWSNLTDGSGNSGAATNTATNQSISADLGSALPVSSVRVGGGTLPNWGAIATYLNSRLIQYSNDNLNWTTAVTISGVTDSGGSQFPVFTFSTVTARYWRIFIATTNYVATSEFAIFP